MTENTEIDNDEIREQLENIDADTGTAAFDAEVEEIAEDMSAVLGDDFRETLVIKEHIRSMARDTADE